MQTLRLCLAGVLLALAACTARAETPRDDRPAATSASIPAALSDLPYIAGIAGNDIVHAHAVKDIVRRAVVARDFASLSAMETYFRTSRSRLPGGTWELDTFHDGVVRALTKRRDESGPCAIDGEDFTKAWADHDPAQPGPYIAAAALRLNYAWCIRGSGRASTVSQEAWAPFRQNVDAAHDMLAAHANVAKKDPEYYALMERIYTAQGKDAEAFQRLLDEGSAREPYYYGIYFNAAWNAMPQWGGSEAAVDRIARYAMARTREQDGAGAYARVYWFITSCNCAIDGFPIDRTLLAKSMDDVLARRPTDWNAAHFAQIACRLDERDLAAKEFGRGGREDGIEWEDRGEWQKCRALAGLGN